jgi:hypothetical protein
MRLMALAASPTALPPDDGEEKSRLDPRPGSSVYPPMLVNRSLLI